MAINFAAIQAALKILKEAGPWINELRQAYVKRGASEPQAQAAAELTIVLEQLLEKKLEDVPRRQDLDRFRLELLREVAGLRRTETQKSTVLPLVLLGANLITIILRIVVLLKI